jgi:hypothetical protein
MMMKKHKTQNIKLSKEIIKLNENIDMKTTIYFFYNYIR